MNSYLRAIVVARSCFAEAELSEAINRGVRQYVILGAGIDTFAYRNLKDTDELHVFEVDYPATQDWKRRLLNEANIRIPETLNFVPPVDFETQLLADRLKAAGFRTDELTFFSWLGVTMYLTHETMIETMKFITASIPSGNRIVFDYIVSPYSQKLLRRFVFYLLSKKLERAGEPRKSFYDPELLITDLKSTRFSKVEDIGSEGINKLFFTNRAENLMVGNFGHLMKAEI